MQDEMEKKQESEIAVAGRRGHEEPVSQEDLIIPRVKLLQALSPEVQENPKDFHQGMIVNSVTKEPLPLDAEGWLAFVPIKRGVNWIRFNARNDKEPGYDPAYELGQIIWRSSDPRDPRVLAEGKFGENGERPLAVKFINYLAYVPGAGEMPIVLSFAKTSFKAGKTLSTLTAMLHGADDLFRWKYRVRAKKEQNDAKQQYFVLEVSQAGKTQDDEFLKAEAIYEAFKNRELKVDEESHDDAEDGAKKQPWEA